jgi:hypothetical protein
VLLQRTHGMTEFVTVPASACVSYLLLQGRHQLLLPPPPAGCQQSATPQQLAQSAPGALPPPAGC